MRTEIEITSQEIADLITSAMEGGSSYWCAEAILITPDPVSLTFPWYADPKLYDVPFVMEVTPHEDELVQVSKREFEAGLALFAKDRHFGDLLADNADAETGDVFFQLCCFGEVRYG